MIVFSVEFCQYWIPNNLLRVCFINPFAIAHELPLLHRSSNDHYKCLSALLAGAYDLKFYRLCKGACYFNSIYWLSFHLVWLISTSRKCRIHQLLFGGNFSSLHHTLPLPFSLLGILIILHYRSSCFLYSLLFHYPSTLLFFILSNHSNSFFRMILSNLYLYLRLSSSLSNNF